MVKVPSTPKSREKLWDEVKSAYRSIADTRVAEGLATLGKVGGHVLTGIVGGVVNYLGYETLINPNLKIQQKILPAIGVGLAITTMIPVAVVSLVGISILVPPFSAVASLAGIFKNITEYYKERAERNNLRKVLVSQNELFEKIDKSKLNTEDKKITKQYASMHKDLYSSLYAVRQIIIESGQGSGFSTEDKINLVMQVNAALESVHNGENKPLMLQLPGGTTSQMKEILSYGADVANRNILQYREVEEAYSKIKLSSSLKSRISKYKNLREGIFSQDLPEKLKVDILELLEKNKKAKQDKQKIQDIFNRVGNHYLNITSQMQNAMLSKEGQINILNQVYPEMDFPSPNIKHKSKIDKFKFVGAVSDAVFSSTKVENAQNIAKGGVSKAKSGLIKRLFGKEGLVWRKERARQKELLKIERKGVEAHFEEQFGPVFDGLHQKERLAFLEKSTNRRLANVGIGVGNAALSIAATGLMASAATPGAPIAIAGAVIGGVATAFTVASLANSISISQKANKAKERVEVPFEKVKRAVVPDLQTSSSKRVLKQFENQRAAKPGLTKTEPSSDKARHFKDTHPKRPGPFS